MPKPGRVTPLRQRLKFRHLLWMGAGAVGLGGLILLGTHGQPLAKLTLLRPHITSHVRTALARLDSTVSPWAGRRDPYAQTPTPNASASVSASASTASATPTQPSPLPAGDKPQPVEATIDLDAGKVVAATPEPAAGQPPAPVKDIAPLRAVLAAYHAGHVPEGDGLAKGLSDPMARLTADWVALRLAPKDANLARLTGFLTNNPDWPAAAWVRRRVEEALLADKDPTQKAAQDWFASHPPETSTGRVVQARVWHVTGHGAEAEALIRALWRGEDCAGGLEAHILKTYGALLTPADHAARAARLLYKDSTQAAGLRAATLAGGDVLALAKVRVAVLDERANDTLLSTIPASLTTDPAAHFARIQVARRAKRLGEAARLMLAAPREPAALLDPDAWWAERRTLARQLLDAGEAKTAYEISAGAAPTSSENQLEAAFLTGWIALRYTQDPTAAMAAFTKLAGLAETPMSRSRAAYWQGRAAEAAQNPQTARLFYQKAAENGATFYGQMARDKLGAAPVPPVRRATVSAAPAAHLPALRVVALLFAAGARDLAAGLALDAAKSLNDPAQMAALAQIAQDAGDAQATLAVGKAANQRGFALDEAAFPTFGVPHYTPLSNSAERDIVYAIARQESAFQTKAVSSAGARGLMQMMAATARRTAGRAKVAFSPERLLADPAYNAQLGAAHLGDLLREQGGSLILTFAAYNAGGGRVKEWIAAHGDPRQKGVDAIDWIERIPIAETRNYVQRVMENVQMYRARFAEGTTAIRE